MLRISLTKETNSFLLHFLMFKYQIKRIGFYSMQSFLRAKRIWCTNKKKKAILWIYSFCFRNFHTAKAHKRWITSCFLTEQKWNNWVCSEYDKTVSHSNESIFHVNWEKIFLIIICQGSFFLSKLAFPGHDWLTTNYQRPSWLMVSTR